MTIVKGAIGMVVALAFSAAQAVVLDFEDYAAGTIIDTEYAGVTISADGLGGSAPDVAVVFDANSPTGGDADLGAPFSSDNPDLVDEYDPGNLLIIQERNDCDSDSCATPDDDANGGRLIFEFDQAVTINSIDVFDIESNESGGEFELFVFTLDTEGSLLDTFSIPVTGGDNTYDRVLFGDDASNVGKLGIFLVGSGAIDNLDFTVVPVPPALLLFGSALALLGTVRRRLAPATA